MTMKNIAEVLESVKTVGIGGHIRPDGDCVGSCMALYLYIRTYFPDIDVTVYLDHPKPIFGHIECIDEIKTEADDSVYDLFITCDVSARDRLALAGNLFENAKKTVCIDHHVSNPGFADINYVQGDISSCCEVLYGILDSEKVTLPIATAIYTGMVHDTGVFQYSSTSPETMRIAGELMNLSIKKHIFRIRLWDVCLQKVSFSRTVHALLDICEEEIWISTALRAVIWMEL